MGKVIGWILIIIGIGFLIYIGIYIYVALAFSGTFETTYSKKDLIDNYNTKSKEIIAVKNYFRSIVPKNSEVDIEFDGKRTLAIFHVSVNKTYESNWDIKINSPKAKALLQKLGWTEETLFTLKEKLDNANCISIASGEPCTVGFKRSGMGMYFYKVFNTTLNDSLKNEYDNGCTYIYYKDNIVLEYGGGAVGPQCFEDFERPAK